VSSTSLPTAYHVYRGLVALLRELEAPDPESALSCLRAYVEWPPTFVIFPADDVKEDLSEVLTALLERPVSPDMPRWRLDAKEARKIADLFEDG
jgi:hypothetical protein